MNPLGYSIQNSEFFSEELRNSILNSEPSSAQQIAFEKYKCKKKQIDQTVQDLRSGLSRINLQKIGLENEIMLGQKNFYLPSNTQKKLIKATYN